MLFFQDFVLFFHDFMQLLQHIASIWFIFLLIGFIVSFCLLYSHENLYMIHHDLDLYYDIYNTIINITEEKLTTFHQFQIILISIFK